MIRVWGLPWRTAELACSHARNGGILGRDTDQVSYCPRSITLVKSEVAPGTADRRAPRRPAPTGAETAAMEMLCQSATAAADPAEKRIYITRGVAILVGNTYEGGAEPVPGVARAVAKAEAVLKSFGWEVHNLGCVGGGRELTNSIDDVISDRLPAKDSEGAKDGLLFLAHGHGDERLFHGNDGAKTSYDQIVAKLDHSKFANKPKIAIFDCCYGHTDAFDAFDRVQLGDTKDIAQKSDFLICRPVGKGFTATATSDGGAYTNALMDEFAKRADRWDVQRMIRLVHHDFHQRTGDGGAAHLEDYWGFYKVWLAGPEVEPEPEEAEPPRTFATSNFKREYAKTGLVTIRHAHLVMTYLDTFLYTFVHVYGITAEADGRLDPFLAALKCQVQRHPDPDAAAEVLWTSATTFEGMGEFNKELYSLLNRAIRDDHPDLAASTAAMARFLNALGCVSPTWHAPFPSGGITWRGTGFDDSLRDFFTEGKEYRVPGFLATSSSHRNAQEFIYVEATAYDKPGVLWKVHVNPAGAQDPSQHCKNVIFYQHAHVPDQQDYIFAAYSVFTIRKVTWSADPTSTPHLIELDAALDNALCSEDLPLAPWY